jgi:hypothetical protein
MRLEIFMAVKIQVMVFWDMMLCTDVVRYQCSEGPCYLHLLPEDGGRWHPATSHHS